MRSEKKSSEKMQNNNFGNIYEKYYNSIYKKLLYLTGDRTAAEDLTQETFLKLYQAPPFHSNTKGWLYKVATNLAYNYLRDTTKRNKKVTLFLRTELLELHSSETTAIQRNEINNIRKILNILPPRDQIILLLKHSGYKYNEISEILRINKNSIGTILARAQAKFKKLYFAKTKEENSKEE